MQNFPWVTHGTEICKIILHNLLKDGAQRVIIWGHFMQKCMCMREMRRDHRSEGRGTAGTSSAYTLRAVRSIGL